MATAKLEGKTMTDSSAHLPVMPEEAVALVRPRHGAVILDATLGAGGHSERLLEAVGPEGTVVGIDRDADAVAYARRRLARFGDAFVPIRGDFREIDGLLAEVGIFSVDGILADLGVSSRQLDDPARGFSFLEDGPLDMRVDRDSGDPGAAELLESIDETTLRRILRELGEERRATAIARAIVRARKESPIRTTGRLRAIVEKAAGPASRKYKIHPATRTFMALRIAVNRELEDLDGFIERATARLVRRGRLAIIAFHSLEDRIVKHTFRGLAQRCICPPKLPVCACGRENLVRLVTPRALRPTEDEVAANPRARSARLRAVERL